MPRSILALVAVFASVAACGGNGNHVVAKDASVIADHVRDQSSQLMDEPAQSQDTAPGNADAAKSDMRSDAGAGLDASDMFAASVTFPVGNQKLDLLFVVANNESSAPVQTQLIGSLATLFDALGSLGSQGLALDVHVGVITSDYGAGPQRNQACDASPGLQAGKLQPLGAAAATGCMPPVGSNFLSLSFGPGGPTGNLPSGQDAAATLGCMASAGNAGCGFVHPLEASRAALVGGLQENQGFLRPDAILGVVYVGDLDDSSAPPTTDLFDVNRAAEYGAFNVYRGVEYGVECNGDLAPYGDSGGPLANCVPAPNPNNMGPGKLFDVSRYVDLLTQPASAGGMKRDPADIVLLGIMGPASPFAVALDGNTGAPCAMISSFCLVTVQPSCTNPAKQIFGNPSVRLTNVISAAQNHVLQSDCDDDYGPGLQAFADKLGGRAHDCVPAPLANPDNPDCIVTDSDGMQAETVIPRCANPPTVFPCWTVAPSTACTDRSPQGLELTVLRNGQAAPANHTLSATCQNASAACVPAEPCLTGITQLLCQAGACTPCTDAADDDACRAVYGSGNLCQGGACVVGCRSDGDCPGTACLQGQCGACTSDSECNDPQLPICKLSSGHCVGRSQCTPGNDGAACPVNPADICCGTDCVFAECCGATACTAPTAPPNSSCQDGHCVSVSCAAPPTGNTLYVDPTAVAGGNGSTPTCALQTLRSALAVASTLSGGPITILVAPSGITPATEGVTASFNPTTLAGTQLTIQGADPATRSPISFGATLGFVFTPSAATAFTLKNLDIIGDSQQSTGLFIGGGATVTLDHVTVRSFQTGIVVTSAGVATIGAGVSVSSNVHGLSGLAGSRTSITVPVGQDATIFEQNTTEGLSVTGTAALVMSGDAGSQTVQVNANPIGIRLSSSNPANALTGISVGGNTDSGLTFSAQSVVKVRSCHIHDNNTGINVIANGSSRDVSGIDLGQADPDPGLNSFRGNSGTSLCLATNPLTAADELSARGNSFDFVRVTDCSMTAPGDVDFVAGCVASRAGADIGFTAPTGALACHHFIRVANCNYTSC